MNKTSNEVKKLMVDMGKTATEVANFLEQTNASLRGQRLLLQDELAKAKECNVKQRNVIYHQRQAIEELCGALSRVSECLQQLQKQ